MRWAVIPSCALILNSVVTTILQIRNPGSYLSKKIIPGRTSALIPSPLTGRHGPQPSGEGLVVFHLGTQANHPLGIGGPSWDKMGEYFNPMIKDLREHKDEYGLISMSEWTSSDRESHNTKLWTFYFRDLEGLHKFAHGALHRKGWDGYHKGKNWNKNIGIFHETYVVQPGGYETVYVNSYPVLLGRGTVKAPTDGEERYVNTLVGADVPALKTQWTRLGRDADGKAKEVDNP